MNQRLAYLGSSIKKSLVQAGFEVEAFEISEPRVRYAREKLDVVTRVIDAMFWRAQLQGLKFMPVSNPYDLDLVSQWLLSGSGVESRSTPKVSGDELLVLARKR